MLPTFGLEKLTDSLPEKLPEGPRQGGGGGKAAKRKREESGESGEKVESDEPRTSRRRTGECWAFKKGTCRFGTACKFAHDGGADGVPAAAAEVGGIAAAVVGTAVEAGCQKAGEEDVAVDSKAATAATGSAPAAGAPGAHAVTADGVAEGSC
jgi:hypothetical protein